MARELGIPVEADYNNANPNRTLTLLPDFVPPQASSNPNHTKAMKIGAIKSGSIIVQVNQTLAPALI